MDILWLSVGPLQPLDSGDKLRTYNMLRQLHRRHQVTFLAHFPVGTDEALQVQADEYSSHHIWVRWREPRKRSFASAWGWCRNLLFSPRPHIIDLRYREAYVDALRHEVEHGGHDLVVCDSLLPSLNLLRLDRESIRIPVVLLQHQVGAHIRRRLAEAATNPLRRAYMENQWQRMVRYERQICEWSTGVILVSPDDAETMRREYGLENVLGAVPTGVDADYFRELQRERRPDNIVFLGAMDLERNIAGAEWFVNEVYPRVAEACPAVTLSIVGRRPARRVVALAEADASIEVSGTVPDIRPYLAAGSVSVVPLRTSGGTRIKVFESMAAGLPVVSTRLGVEGLPLADGTHCFLADDPEAFANRVIELLKDPAAAQAMADTAAQWVRDEFGWERVADAFAGLCEQVLP